MTLGGIGNTARADLAGGSRAGLRAAVAYSVLTLALCLMIADFCRLISERFSEEGVAPRSPVAWGSLHLARASSPSRHVSD